MPPGSHGPTDPASTASAALGTRWKRARRSAQLTAATANQSNCRKSMLSAPVTSSWQSAPRRMASANRTAMCGLDEKCPGDASKRPAPVARYPVSKSEITMARSENACMSSFARAMRPNTSTSDSTVVP